MIPIPSKEVKPSRRVTRRMLGNVFLLGMLFVTNYFYRGRFWISDRGFYVILTIVLVGIVMDVWLGVRMIKNPDPLFGQPTFWKTWRGAPFNIAATLVIMPAMYYLIARGCVACMPRQLTIIIAGLALSLILFSILTAAFRKKRTPEDS